MTSRFISVVRDARLRWQLVWWKHKMEPMQYPLDCMFMTRYNTIDGWVWYRIGFWLTSRWVFKHVLKRLFDRMVWHMLQILCYNLHHLQDGLSVAGIACKSYQWMLNRHMSCQSVLNLARRPQNQNIGTLFYYFSTKLNDDNVWFKIGWVVISMVYLMLED